MFALLIPSRPCLTTFTTVSPTQFAFTFPAHPHFSHIVVFILPDQTLPPDAAAGVHLQFPGQQDFHFLGAIAADKPSAIFKVNLPATASQGEVNLGVSVEPVAQIQAQLRELEVRKQQQQQQQRQVNGSAGAGSGLASPLGSPTTVTHSGGSLVRTGEGGVMTTKLLAQRIIKNAFNFLASFSGTVGPGGEEVVPLKSFREWWVKFERRVEVDPGFLERDQGD